MSREITPGLITSLCVGLKGEDYVIIGTSKRSLYGSLIMSEKTTLIKIFGNRVIVTFSGHVPDVQYMFRELSWFFQVERLNRDRDLSIEEVAKYTGMVLFSFKLFPNIAFGIIGGIDIDQSPRLFDLDPLGSIIEEDYVAAGISAEVAYGLMESSYDKKMSLSKAKDLITRVLSSVARRDVLVGRFAEIAYIKRGDKKGTIETVKML
ncbi:MAG: hypothetical protein Q6363_000835 [Candidatus Njordarchaeota archaeon]